MKIFLLFLFFLFGSGLFGEDVPLLSLRNSTPFYGAEDPDKYELNQADKTFVDGVVTALGGPQPAYIESLRRAQKQLQDNNFIGCIQRANGAWLLDRTRYEACYLIGIACLSLYNNPATEDPVQYLLWAQLAFREALKRNPEHGESRVHLGRTYRDLAMWDTPRDLSSPKSLENLKTALKNFDMAQAQTADPKFLGYIYYQQAITYAMLKQFEMAWSKIKAVRQVGCQSLIEPGFLELLTLDMIEP